MADSHFRRSSREPVTITVRYVRDEPGAVLERTGQTSDLGLGGAFIETEDPPPLGSRIVLRVSSHATWETLELPADVRWLSTGDDDQPQGFGIRFGKLSGPQATALYHLVHSNRFTEPSR